MILAALLVAAGAPIAGAAPAELWVRTFDGAGSGRDQATAVAVSQAAVAVTGLSHGGATGSDFATLKYRLDGAPLWAAASTWDGPESGVDYAYDVAIDGAGHVYVAGLSGTRYLATLKLDRSDGHVLWQATYDLGGICAYPEVKGALLQLDAGNVYVVGGSDGGCSTLVVLRYDAATGALVWAAAPSPPLVGAARGLRVEAGSVHVVATTLQGGTSRMTTLKLDAGSGALVWMSAYAGLPQSFARGLAVDGFGNVYVCGSGDLVKYDPAGTLQWTRRPGGSPYGMAIDSQGRVVVTGEILSGNSTDYLTVQYDAAGNLRWSRTEAGVSGGLNDGARAVAVDQSDHVLVTGYMVQKAKTYATGVGTIRYTSAGSRRWTRVYLPPGTGHRGLGIASDAAGNVYVAGALNWNTSSADFVALKYAP